MNTFINQVPRSTNGTDVALKAALLYTTDATGAKVELNCKRYFMLRPISHALNNVMCLYERIQM